MSHSFPQPFGGSYQQQPQPHQMQIQQQPGAIVTEPRFIVQQPTCLVLRENMHSFSGDDFTIRDVHGNLWFQMDAKAFAMREKRHLLDVSKVCICTLQRKMISMSGAWNIYRGNSTDDRNKLAIVKPKMFTLSPKVCVYLQDGDQEADYEIKGNFRARKFDVYQMPQKRLVAQCRKESSYSSMGAFMRNKWLEKSSYYLDILPGADAAFIVSLVVCLDEEFHDKN